MACNMSEGRRRKQNEPDNSEAHHRHGPRFHEWMLSYSDPFCGLHSGKRCLPPSAAALVPSEVAARRHQTWTISLKDGVQWFGDVS